MVTGSDEDTFQMYRRDMSMINLMQIVVMGMQAQLQALGEQQRRKQQARQHVQGTAWKN